MLITKHPFLYLFFSCMFLFIGCANPNGELKNLQWLEGTWALTTEDGMYEMWSNMNDTLFQGRSFKVDKQDTIEFEKITIGYRDNTLCYMPTVSNQNNGQTIIFKNVSRQKNQMIFENPKHDYPQRIVYTLSNDTTLLVNISNISPQQTKRQSFHFRRIN